MENRLPETGEKEKRLEVDILAGIGGRQARRIRFAIGGDRDLLVIRGESGCGKTSLLRVIAGLDPPLSGSVRFGNAVWDDAEIHLPSSARPIAYLPQRDCLYPHLSLRSNIALPLSRREGVRSFLPGWLFPKNPVRRFHDARVEEMIETMGLSSVADVPVESLSGGQRKRAVLARLLLLEAELVLLDEPLNGLDPKAREWCSVFLRNWFREKGSLVLWVTHDPREESLLSGEVLDFDAMEEGPESTERNARFPGLDKSHESFSMKRSVL